MGSKADFYMGRGIESEWLGSIQWDGMPASIPSGIINANLEETYREEVDSFLVIRGDGVHADAGWPWKWDTSHGTKYAYAFDTKTCCVMASCFGSSWWLASKTEPEHTTLKRKAASFPDMAMAKKGGGVFYAKPKTKKNTRP
jgi:hypothetical protein